MQVSLTYRCNLRCKMCNIAGLLPEEEELSTAQVERAIDEAKKYGIKEIIFTGGEPFLRGDIFRLCGYAARNNLRSIITTNGVLIDDGLAESIASSEAGHIHFSLDGLEDSNDFFRGSGTFNKITRAIQLLLAKRTKGRFFSVGIALTVMEKNVRELSAITEFADNLGVDVINFQPLVKNNANFIDHSLPEFWVKDDSLAILEKEIAKIRKFKPRHISVFEEPHLELLVKYYQGRLNAKDWVCFGGFKTVFICYEKNKPLIYSCHGICGDLDRVSLKKAWSSKEARALREHSKKCRNLCMQSCYSFESAQSLRGLANSLARKFK